MKIKYFVIASCILFYCFNLGAQTLKMQKQVFSNGFYSGQASDNGLLKMNSTIGQGFATFKLSESNGNMYPGFWFPDTSKINADLLANKSEVNFASTQRNQTKTDSIKFTNIGKVKLKIKTIDITGNNSNLFMKQTGNKNEGDELAIGDSIIIPIKFISSQTGSFDAAIRVICEYDNKGNLQTLTKSVPLKAVTADQTCLSVNDLLIENSYVNFDNRRGVLVFTNKNCTQGVDITSHSFDTILNPSQFKIININPAPPCSLSYNKTIEVIVEFCPTKVGKAIAQFSLFDKAGLKTTGNISATGVAIDASTPRTVVQLVSNPSDTVNIGDVVNLLLKIVDSKNTSLTTSSRFEATILYDSQILTSVRKVCLGNDDCIPLIFQPEYLSGRYDIQIYTKEAKYRTDNILLSYNTKATLGRTDSTRLIIQSFKWLDDPILALKINDGVLYVKPCLADGKRLIDFKGSNSAINTLYPNPPNEGLTIDFNILEDGITKLYITDMIGEKRQSIIDAQMTSGNHIINTNVKDLESGVYNIILQTQNEVLKQRLIIVK